MTPPTIVRFNASNVPVVQLTLSSDSLPEETLFDYGLNFIRLKLFTIPGLSVPAPYGGKQRQVNIDVNPRSLVAKGLSATDVVNALQASNLILPRAPRVSGKGNSTSPLIPARRACAFEEIPIKVVNGATVMLGTFLESATVSPIRPTSCALTAAGDLSKYFKEVERLDTRGGQRCESPLAGNSGRGAQRHER